MLDTSWWVFKDRIKFLNRTTKTMKINRQKLFCFLQNVIYLGFFILLERF